MARRLTPISRRHFIQRLQKLGFEGPYAGGRHEFMLRQERRLILPNPHRSDISVALLTRLLRRPEFLVKSGRHPLSEMTCPIE